MTLSSNLPPADKPAPDYDQYGTPISVRALLLAQWDDIHRLASSVAYNLKPEAAYPIATALENVQKYCPRPVFDGYMGPSRTPDLSRDIYEIEQAEKNRGSK